MPPIVSLTAFLLHLISCKVLTPFLELIPPLCSYRVCVAMAEYALAMEEASREQLEPDVDDCASEDSRGRAKTLERLSSGHVFPISITEIRGNKLIPIQEHTSPTAALLPDQDHSLVSGPEMTLSHPMDALGIPPPSLQTVSPIKSPRRSRSLSRPSPLPSPRVSSSSRSVDTSLSKMSPSKASPSSSVASGHHPRSSLGPQETTSSRLRRERLASQSNQQNLPFGYSRSSGLKPIPNSTIEPKQKTERKPYIDYLRQKVSGKPPASAEKKH
jgi:hypothetical protein